MQWLESGRSGAAPRLSELPWAASHFTRIRILGSWPIFEHAHDGRAKFILTISMTNNYIAVIMLPPISLGEFEQVVLLAILRLGENAYGVTIRNEITECTGREPAPGALYTTIDRMEAKGLVQSRMGDPTPQRGGRAKRYIKVTNRGRAAVIAAQRSYQSLLQGLDLLGGANA